MKQASQWQKRSRMMLMTKRENFAGPILRRQGEVVVREKSTRKTIRNSVVIKNHKVLAEQLLQQPEIFMIN